MGGISRLAAFASAQPVAGLPPPGAGHGSLSLLRQHLRLRALLRIRSRHQPVQLRRGQLTHGYTPPLGQSLGQLAGPLA